MHRDLQLSSRAIVCLVLKASRNVPLLPVPKGTAPAMSVLLRLCAAPLGRGSGSRAGPGQEQRSAVVVGKAQYGDDGMWRGGFGVGSLEVLWLVL